jgi:NTE family protein
LSEITLFSEGFVNETAGMTVGIVLGSGGLVGPTFHLAALRHLRDSGRVDPDSADVFVGTSGGSIVASLLAAGIPFDKLLRAFRVTGANDMPADEADVADDDRALATAVHHLLSLPPLGWGPMQRPRVRRRDSPTFRARVALRTSSLFAEGAIDPMHYARPFVELMGQPWPSRLRVCAVERTTGVRTVFGPWSNVKIAEACAASCAVPGLFQPVAIDDANYSDGGFYSPTNADVVLDDHLDQVIVISPMSSRPRSLPVSTDHPIRLALHAPVALEARALRRQGALVTIIEPDRAVRRAIGSNYLDSDRLPAVALAALAKAPPQNRARTGRRRLIPLEA